MMGSMRPACGSLRLLLLTALLLLGCAAPTARGEDEASYLGCFSFSRLLYLKGVEGVKATQYDRSTVRSCSPKCAQLGYSLSIIATDYRCWCALATPDVGARVDDSACGLGSSKGALVFYHYAGSNVCRLDSLPVEPSSFELLASNSRSSVVFDGLGEFMSLRLHGTTSARAVAKLPPQQYGQVEVMARVSAQPGVVTSIELLDAEAAQPAARGLAVDDISLHFFNTTPTGTGKNMLLTTGSSRDRSSAMEHLVKPAEYKATGRLAPEENIQNTWTTFTIHWQPNVVTWGMNGVPLFTKHRAPAKAEAAAAQQAWPAQVMTMATKGRHNQQHHKQHQFSPQHHQPHQQARIAQQQGQPAAGKQRAQPWAPPSKPARLAFSIRWAPQAGLSTPAGLTGGGSDVEAGQHAGLESGFMDIRRIVCDQPRVRGHTGPRPPAWFVLGPGFQEVVRPQAGGAPPRARPAAHTAAAAAAAASAGWGRGRDGAPHRGGSGAAAAGAASGSGSLRGWITSSRGLVPQMAASSTSSSSSSSEGSQLMPRISWGPVVRSSWPEAMAAAKAAAAARQQEGRAAVAAARALDLRRDEPPQEQQWHHERQHDEPERYGGREQQRRYHRYDGRAQGWQHWRA